MAVCLGDTQGIRQFAYPKMPRIRSGAGGRRAFPAKLPGMTGLYAIDEISALSAAEFIRVFGGIYEHSPWVAEAAYACRPFESLDALESAMRAVVENAATQKQVGILSAHPEFSGTEAKRGTLTTHSRREQSRLDLDALTGDELQRMLDINRRFMKKYGFPGIVAVRLHESIDGVFSELDRRIENDYVDEIRDALDQVHQIARFRLHDLINEDFAAPV